MADELFLQVGMDVSTEKAQQQLKQLSDQWNKTFVKNTQKKIDKDTWQEVVTYTNAAGKSFQVLQTKVRDTNNEYVTLEEKVISISQGLKNLNTTTVSTSKSTAKLSESTAQVGVNAQNQNNALKALSTVTKEVNASIQQNVNSATNETSKTEANTQSIKTNTLSREEYLKILEKNVRWDNEVSTANNKLASSAQNVTNSNTAMGQSFADIIAKVAKFYLATVPIQMMQRAMTDSIQVVKDFDSAITEFNKVSSLSNAEMKDYTETLSKYGAEVARTTTEMVQGATEFKKAGFSEEDSANLAKIAALYQNTADEELSASEATSVLVSQLKVFNYTAEDSIHITDAINQVSQDFAVSSGDIGRGLTQAGAALSTYGNSFEQTIGLVTAGTEIFQGKSQQVSRGLNTVASRVAKNEEALKKYGVEIHDENKQLRSTYDILADLAKEWEHMSNEEKVSLGTTLAGVNQYKVFSAVMNNFGQAVKASQSAMDSQGATLRQNEVYMDSIEAKTNQLKQSFEQLVIGDGGITTLVKQLLDLGNALLKLANTDIGKVIIEFTALVVALTAIKSAVDNLSISFARLTVSMSTNPIGLLIVAVAGLTAAFLELDRVLDHSNQLQSKQQILEQITNEYNQVATELETIQKRIEEIQNERLHITDANDLNLLNEEENSLRKQLIILQQKQKLLDQQKSEAAEASLNQTVDYMQIEYRPASGTDGGFQKEYRTASGTRVGALLSELQVTRDLEEEQSNLLKRQDELLASGKDLTDETSNEGAEFKQNEERIAELQHQMDEYKLSLLEESQALKDEANNLDISKQKNKELQQSVYAAVGSVDAYYGIVEKVNEEDITEPQTNLQRILEDTTGAYEEQANQLEELSSKYDLTETELNAIADLMIEEGLSAEEASKKLGLFSDNTQAVNDKIDNLQSALKTAKKAQEEYNAHGQLSVDTFQELMNTSNEYLLALVNEKGQIDINKDTLGNYVQVLKDAKIADLQRAAAADLSNVATGNLENISNLAKDAISKLGDESETASEKLVKGGAGAEAFAVGVSDAYKELTGEDLTNAMNDRMQAVLDAYNKVAEGIDKVGVSTADWNKETKESKKLASELKQQYQIALSYIEEMYKKQKQAIEDARDAELDAIDDEITALEEQKKAREKYWDTLIDQLKKENDERQKSIDLQQKQEALAKAKATKVRVFQDGEFVYQEDEAAVSKAEQDLQDYLQKQAYEEELDRLKQQKEAEMNNFDERIDNLKKYRKQKQKEYEEELKILEKQKNAVKEQVDDYEIQQKRLITAQMLGIEEQKMNWDTMISNLKDFVKKWNSELSSMDTVGEYTPTAKSTGDNSVTAYASGTNSVGDYQTAVVGDNPKYQELVIGSKINHDQGLVMKLKRGSGVVNANSTNTLAGLFNSLSGFASNNFGRANGSLTNNSTSNNLRIDIGNISLPNVANGNDFVNYLQNFSLDLIQTAY